VSSETPQVPSPSIAERTIDAATDMSRTVGEVTAALRVAVDRLREVIANAERPGQPIARLRAVTRQAPLRSLFVAFLLGVVLARRR
jgi:ABC-type transporter Mla maintaining outer membrane lipid asymmetry permease subunit MlaE